MEWEPFIRLLAAAGFAGAIGLDRELRAKPAGLRTNIVVGVAAGAFAYTGLNAFPAGDPSRVAAQIVSGIGFLGGGAIFAAGGKPHGLTTAAALWGSAAAGLAAGTGAYATGLALVVVTVLALWPLDRAASSLLAARRRSNVRIAVVVRDLDAASRVRALLGGVGVGVDHLEMRPFGDQGVAMELVANATRANLEEAVGRLRLHDDVLFVSEEAVPRVGGKGLRARHQGRHAGRMQSSHGLTSQTDTSQSWHAKRGALGGGRQPGQQPLFRSRYNRPGGSNVGLESNRNELADADARASDWDDKRSPSPGMRGGDPFSHLRQAGLRRLSEARERAILQELTLDLWEPPGDLLREKGDPHQVRLILGGFRVYDLVPRRFQAYARVFHPLQGRAKTDPTSFRVRSADIFAGNSDSMGRDMRPARTRGATARCGQEPLIGVLDRQTTVGLAEVLKRHTHTPQTIYFLFWAGLVGFGAGQRNAIYEAPIEVVASFYPYGVQAYLSPTLWWDAAGQWFVATHPDSNSTYVGGSTLLVRELSTSRRIEAVEVQPQTFVDVVIPGRPE